MQELEVPFTKFSSSQVSLLLTSIPVLDVPSISDLLLDERYFLV